ncbi:MAG TPA: pitrilysin family protein [bacterium]|nr:pitrilysin family protein [bacterium]
MAIKLIKLKNDLSVFLIKLPAVKTTTVLTMFKTGSRYETKKNSGLSHFIEHLFFKGTIKRPSTLILSSELDSIGAEFNAFTSKEFTGYYIKSAKNKIGIAIDVLSDLLSNSKFDSEEIEREKGVIIEELNMYKDNPKLSIEDVFENCLYGDTPAGRDTIGNKKNILSFKRKDVLQYFSNQYGTKNMAIFLAGNFNEKNIIKELNEKFGNFRKNDYKNKIKVIEKQNKPKAIIKNKKIDQVVLSLGFRAFPANNRDEYPLKLLSVILGGSMSSRLFIKLRERQGLAYSVYTNIETYSDSGYITVYAGVPKDKVIEAIKVILQEYSQIKKDLVSKEELQKAKDLIAGKIIVQMEGSDDFSSWYGHQFINNLKFKTPEDFLQKIKQVKALDIKRVAQKLFVSSGLNLALIGDIKNKKKIIDILKID